MGVKLKNNVTGFIDAAISASDVYIMLKTGNGALFPVLAAGDYFYATLVSTSGTIEIIKATARTGDLLTVVRGQEGTTPNSFASGTRIEMRVTAQSIIDLVGQLVLQAQTYNFTGTGTDTTFTMSSTLFDPRVATVAINGTLLRYSDDYSISGTTLSFTSPPALNDSIMVKWPFIRDGFPLESEPIYIILE